MPKFQDDVIIDPNSDATFKVNVIAEATAAAGVTIDGLLIKDGGISPTTSTTLGVSGSSAGTLTTTIDAVNAGAGEGRTAINADDQININDGTLDIQMDAGVVTETGMVSIDLTPSGAMTLRGGGASQFGDDTGYLAFDGAGAASTTGITTVDLDCSGALQINSSAGAISIGNDAVAQAVNLATGAAARVITIGNAASASLALEAGVGALSANADTTATITAGGNVVLDSTGATSAIYVTTGTDTSATEFAVRNNSESRKFIVRGDGTIDATITGIADYADDPAAALGGVAVGGIYRTGSALKIRIA